MDSGAEFLKQQAEILDAVDEGRRQLDTGEFNEYDDEGLKRRFEELKQQARCRS